jgi:hypothetical protein
MCGVPNRNRLLTYGDVQGAGRAVKQSQRQFYLLEKTPATGRTTYLDNTNVPLIGPLGDLDRLSDELSVATDIGATAAPAATAATESTATSTTTTPTMATALRGMGWAGEAWRHEAWQATGGGGPSTPAATS